MKTFIIAPLASLIILGAFFSNLLHAGEALEQINAEVEQTAVQIEQDYGVLLTGQERNNLKISLVVEKVSKEQKETSVKDKTDSAIQTYEITDPTDQRQLLIEMQANLTGNGGGDIPD